MVKTHPNSVHPKSRAEWRRWLEQHDEQKEGVWLVRFKKATGKPGLDYEEAMEDELCFRWNDRGS
jgi:uncharacterized protein YdeI (YjbR/CyaY-like superfamily)